MLATELNLQEALVFDPQHGKVTLGNSRVVVCGTEAMAALFQELINIGDMVAAQVVMRRFGDANGHERARTVKALFNPADKMEWLAFGPALHAWEGVGLPTLEHLEYNPDQGHFHLIVHFQNSYLAEQYVRVMGQATEPVCWQLAGYIAGYCSEVFGLNLHCRETMCIAKGDPYCRFEVKPREAWL